MENFNPGESEKEKDLKSKIEKLDKLNSLESSMQDVMVDRILEHVDFSIKNMTGIDWQQLNTALESEVKMTDEERGAINSSLSILKSLKAYSTKETKMSLIKRSANKISDIFMATKVLESLSLHPGKTENWKDVPYAVNQLYELAGIFANEEDLKETRGLDKNGLMNDEELKKSKEELSKLNVS